MAKRVYVHGKEKECLWDSANYVLGTRREGWVKRYVNKLCEGNRGNMLRENVYMCTEKKNNVLGIM